MSISVTCSNSVRHEAAATAATVASGGASVRATSSFVKVYCGDDECVPLSKQCTGGVFQCALADLATQTSRHLALESPPPSIKAGPCAAPRKQAAVPNDGTGSRKANVGGPRRGFAKLRRVSNGKQNSTSSAHAAETQTEGLARTTPAETLLSTETNVRAAPVVYRGAELLPLSFVHDAVKNTKVMDLYKKRLRQGQQAEQVARRIEEEDGNGKRKKADSPSTEADKPNARRASSQTKRVLSPNQPRTKAGSITGGSNAAMAESAAASPTFTVGQQRTQLWGALSSFIPFFGALTMPVHTTLEPLVPAPPPSTTTTTTPARASHNTDAGGSTLSFHAPSSPIASVSCAGTYVLLGCRERPLNAEVVEMAVSTSVPVTPNTPADTMQDAKMGGEGPRDDFSRLRAREADRLVERAREASALRLPSLCCDTLNHDLDSQSTPSLSTSANSSFTSSATSSSLHKHQQQQGRQKERHHIVFLEPLPPRYVLQPATNRVVPLPPPLPETIAAGYGAPRLVTRALSPIKKGGEKLSGRKGDWVSQVVDSAFSNYPTSKGSGREGKPFNSIAVAERRSNIPASAPQQLNDPANVTGRRRLSPILSRTSTARKSSKSSLNSSINTNEMPAPKMAVPLSAAAIERLTQVPRFSVHLAHCTVTIATHGADKAGTAENAGEAARNAKCVAGSVATTSASRPEGELCDVFDGFDVLWRGPNGEEVALQWILDEYSALLKERMREAKALWTLAMRSEEATSAEPAKRGGSIVGSQGSQGGKPTR